MFGMNPNSIKNPPDEINLSGGFLLEYVYKTYFNFEVISSLNGSTDDGK